MADDPAPAGDWLDEHMERLGRLPLELRQRVDSGEIELRLAEAALVALERWKALPDDVRSGERPYLMGFVDGYEASFDDDGEACVVCGCTENNACMTDDGPCGWARPGLCTACVEPEKPA